MKACESSADSINWFDGVWFSVYASQHVTRVWYSHSVTDQRMAWLRFVRSHIAFTGWHHITIKTLQLSVIGPISWVSSVMGQYDTQTRTSPSPAITPTYVLISLYTVIILTDKHTQLCIVFVLFSFWLNCHFLFHIVLLLPSPCIPSWCPTNVTFTGATGDQHNIY